MGTFKLLAEPWWVNLLAALPVIAYLVWRKKGLFVPKNVLLLSAAFGAAFGFVEAAVVVYLRAAVGLLAGYGGTLADVADMTSGLYDQAKILGQLPMSLMTVEIVREAATMIMLITIAWLAVSSRRERWAVYFWTFAAWDIFYYIGLWATVRWPSSLLDLDVLFLIPTPWSSQVWYPFFVSGLFLAAVLAANQKGKRIAADNGAVSGN